MPSSAMNEIHTALRQATRLDTANSAARRRGLAIGYALATTMSATAAVTGKSLNPLFKNRELTRFGRVYQGLNALSAAVLTAVVVLETASTDGVELNLRKFS